MGTEIRLLPGASSKVVSIFMAHMARKDREAKAKKLLGRAKKRIEKEKK